MNAPMNLGARQAGATLVVGLILLMVLTVVGVSGMNTATMEVAMSGANQYQQDAFQMAEQGIDLSIGRSGAFPTDAPFPINWLGDPNYDRKSVTSFVAGAPVVGVAFSTAAGLNLGQACHFSIVSVGKAARNSVATHTQNFWIVGPC